MPAATADSSGVKQPQQQTGGHLLDTEAEAEAGADLHAAVASETDGDAAPAEEAQAVADGSEKAEPARDSFPAAKMQGLGRDAAEAKWAEEDVRRQRQAEAAAAAAGSGAEGLYQYQKVAALCQAWKRSEDTS